MSAVTSYEVRYGGAESREYTVKVARGKKEGHVVNKTPIVIMR